MFFYIMVIILTILMTAHLIGLYYFSKQEYNNYFVSLLLNKDKLKLLESKKINEKNYKKLNFILSIRTILLILLTMTLICIFKSHNLDIRYIIVILVYIVGFISNKLIEKIFEG